MYELLHAPLEDKDAYLRRLGVSAPEAPTLEALDGLILAHQCQIPFENLDSYQKKQCPSLAMKDLFEKIVRSRRGGWCFELNTIFTRLLQELGYDAVSVSARIVRGKDFVPPMLHRGILVTLHDGVYYCDVGYGGPQPAFAVPLGGERTVGEETFSCRQVEEDTWLLSRITSEGVWERVLEFWQLPMEQSYFIPLNYYVATSDDSVFTRVRMVNRRTPGGHLSLTDNLLTVKEPGGERKETVPEEKIPGVLRELFFIEY